MNKIKQSVKKDVEMKILGEIGKLKEKILAANKLKSQEDCPPEVIKAIQAIKEKINQCKLAELHPPFLTKTVTRYRHEYFLPLKRQYHSKLSSPNEKQFQSAKYILYSFVARFDCEMFDLYLQQIRQPYIRKIFNENYQFDKLDFKEINTQYKIRSEIENLLNSASEWLLQIEKTQDLLERLELYLDIKTPMIIEKAKKQGIQTKTERSFGDAFSSTLRNITSYTLRKSSKVIQSSFFTAVAPAAAMLTLAIIGGSATLPWKSDISGKLLVAPIIAITVPYLLDGLASNIERKEFIQKLQEWAISLEKVSASISKFNEQIQQTILSCCSAETIEEYAKQKLNLQKYVKILEMSLQNLTNFSEQKIQEMRDRTEAYFQKYIEIQEGEWKIVLPQQEYHQEGLLQTEKK